MKRYWTDEERAILREVYAAYPPCRGRQGAERSAALHRRFPGRTAAAIKNQILVLGLSVQKISLSGKVFEYLTRHGPMDVKGIAEILGASIEKTTNAIGHLARRRAIHPAPDQHCWQIVNGPTDRSRTQRRIDWNAGITEEDLEWMRRYREQRARRLAQTGEQRCY